MEVEERVATEGVVVIEVVRVGEPDEDKDIVVEGVLVDDREIVEVGDTERVGVGVKVGTITLKW